MPRRHCPPAARLVGAYAAPALRVGDRDYCLYRGVLCKVTSYHDGPIAWPQGVPVTGRSAPALIVTEELVRAVRSESALAVRWWWGLSEGVVTRYRRALGVTRTNNARSHELIVSNSARGGEAARDAGCPEEERQARRHRAVVGNYGARLTPGYHGPWWTAEQLALLGTLPDEEVARMTGHSVNGVRIKRTRLGVPTARDGRTRAGRKG